MNNSQNIYRPVPQTWSDSDSDKDIDIHDSRRFMNGKVHQSPKQAPLQEVQNGATITIVKNRKKTRSGMSLQRKIYFVLSIMLCFATVIVFLLLPCDGGMVCPLRISNWEIEHKGFELKGAINVVKDMFNYSKNLVLLFTKNFLNINNLSGVVGLMGTNGMVAWYIEKTSPLFDINCYQIDANADGVTDCLLVKSDGIEVIDPLSGKLLWNVQHLNGLEAIEFPIILPDLNSDKTKEVLLSNGNQFLVINGRNGMIICKHQFDLCTRIELKDYREGHVLFSCYSKNAVRYYKIMFSEIVSLSQDCSHKIKAIATNYLEPPEKQFVLDNHQIIVNASGNCPECTANITLCNVKTNKTLLSQNFQRTFVMQPVAFSFEKGTKNIGLQRNHLNGFILKLWQWDNGNNKSTTQFISSFNITVHINIIKERIILITFNNTNIQVINASITEIIQLCIPNNGEKCQPNRFNQKKSLLLHDMDNDGMMELISYSSTFERESTHKHARWELISKVRVFHLESELPKFYSTPPV